jgi:hypothetical protein
MWLAETNALAYHTAIVISAVKSFIALTSGILDWRLDLKTLYL